MQKKAAADGRKNATEQAKAFYAAYLTAFFNNSDEAYPSALIKKICRCGYRKTN